MAKKLVSAEKSSSSSKERRPPDKPKKKKSQEGLNRAFDPFTNFHLWTMWRSAVNGKIRDSTNSLSDFAEYPLGKSLTRMPLERLITFDEKSVEVAHAMMTAGSDNQSIRARFYGPIDNENLGTHRAYLGVRQFVYFGVPRVVLKK